MWPIAPSQTLTRVPTDRCRRVRASNTSTRTDVLTRSRTATLPGKRDCDVGCRASGGFPSNGASSGIGVGGVETIAGGVIVRIIDHEGHRLFAY